MDGNSSSLSRIDEQYLRVMQAREESRRCVLKCGSSPARGARSLLQEGREVSKLSSSSVVPVGAKVSGHGICEEAATALLSTPSPREGSCPPLADPDHFAGLAVNLAPNHHSQNLSIAFDETTPRSELMQSIIALQSANERLQQEVRSKYATAHTPSAQPSSAEASTDAALVAARAEIDRMRQEATQHERTCAALLALISAANAENEDLASQLQRNETGARQRERQLLAIIESMQTAAEEAMQCHLDSGSSSTGSQHASRETEEKQYTESVTSSTQTADRACMVDGTVDITLGIALDVVESALWLLRQVDPERSSHEYPGAAPSTAVSCGGTT